MMVLPRSSARPRPALRAFARHEDAPRVKHPEPGVDRPHDVVDRVALQQVAQLSDRPASRRTRPPTALSFGWNRYCEERSDEAIQRTCAPHVPLDCSPRVPKPGGRNDDRGSPRMQLALSVSSRTLMAHSYRVIRRMGFGTDSTRERHNDRGGPSSDTT